MFESGCRLVSGRVTIETCSGEPQDERSSALELCDTSKSGTGNDRDASQKRNANQVTELCTGGELFDRESQRVVFFLRFLSLVFASANKKNLSLSLSSSFDLSLSFSKDGERERESPVSFLLVLVSIDLRARVVSCGQCVRRYHREDEFARGSLLGARRGRDRAADPLGDRLLHFAARVPLKRSPDP